MPVDAAIAEIVPAERETEVAASDQRHWDLLRRLEKAGAGTRRQDGSLQIGRTDPPGCMLYGPYLQFPAGPYRLAFDCRCGAPRWPAQPVLGVEIIVLSRFQVAWRDFTAAELTASGGAIDFAIGVEHSLEGENEGRFEFRFFHLGNADLTIGAVTLDALPPDTPIAPRASRWRLLGRLQTSWLGRRTGGGGVAVWQAAPAGRVLYGVWPYMRLPHGAYRLSVHARAGSPRRPGEPVLRAAVLGRSRWLSTRPLRRLARLPEADGVSQATREVTAQEIAAGPVELDFTVPIDLALEAGADAPFDIRIQHLGNAAFRIDAVELCKLDGAADSLAAPSMPLPRLRPAGRRKVVIIGNCQSETLRQGLANTESVGAAFEVKYHFVQLPNNLHEFAARDLETCDVLLIQDIRLWDEFPLRDRVRPGADVARFPLVRFASLWPFDGWNGPTDTEARNREGPNLTFPYLDGLLARLRKEIPDPAARFQAYRSLDIPRIINYRRLHELEERRLIALDTQYGIALGAFILENFRKRRVFHTTVRPDWQVFTLLLQFVAGLLGIKETIALSKNADLLLRNPQVPVHPKVAADLDVRWADESTRYLNHGLEIIWEAYIRRYIEHYG